ncbi:MAG: hypothetical protein MUD01_08345 [Chloroflexaceae bacterium]|jgi:hypothetical protein|nr:hypothetical protein [Chloroflexaceae bacterium]
MAETAGEVRVRNVVSRRNDSFVEAATEFGGGIVRLGFSVLSLPLAVLPRETRGHMRNATRELMYAFATLPRDFADVANEAIEDWARAGDDVDTPPRHAPRDEMAKA